VGPLGGPACTRQAGYHSVLYWASWTATQPLRFAPPPYYGEPASCTKIGPEPLALTSAGGSE